MNVRRIAGPGAGFRALALASLLALSACSDVQKDPLGLPVSSDVPGGAALFAPQPVSLPALLSEWGLESEGSTEGDVWWESWTLGGEDGKGLRSRVYPDAVQRLLPILGERGVGELLLRQGRAVRAWRAAGAALAPGAVREALERAGNLHDDALFHAEEGDLEAALLLCLRSGDALWEIDPRRVAVALLTRARGAAGRKDRVGSYSEEELTRIRRLMNGAEQALEAGDYPRAIRRAYYACQLLGADSS